MKRAHLRAMVMLVAGMAGSGCGADAEVPVGVIEAPLDARKRVLGAEQAAFGDFVTDAMLARARTLEPEIDFAIINAAAIGYDSIVIPSGIYAAGRLTTRETAGMVRFGNKLVIAKALGKAIRMALERGVSAHPRPADRFLQVSRGVQIIFDPTMVAESGSYEFSLRSLLREYRVTTPGRRIVRVSVANEPLDDRRTYTFATTDYLARGSGGFGSLRDSQVRVVGGLREALESYLKEHSPLRSERERRIDTTARSRRGDETHVSAGG